MPVLLVVACAAGGLNDLAARLVRPAVGQGWTVQVVPTPNAEAWLTQTGRLGDLTALAAEPVSATSDYRREPDAPPTQLPDAAVAAPATFGTINKLAAGIADNRATTKLCELLGARPARPVGILPNVNAAHVRHPVCSASMSTLRAIDGVTLLDDANDRRAEPGGNSGPLPWDRLLDILTGLANAPLDEP